MTKNSTYDPEKLCTDKGEYYEVAPAVMFQSTLERIKDVNASNLLPPEIYDGNQVSFMNILKQAKTFSDDDLALATNRRNDVLAFAESYFQRAMIFKAQSLGLNKKRFAILNDPDYKRSK